MWCSAVNFSEQTGIQHAAKLAYESVLLAFDSKRAPHRANVKSRIMACAFDFEAAVNTVG